MIPKKPFNNRVWNYLSSTLQEFAEILQPYSKNYRVYIAVINQSGTDAPVATVLENTLGGEVTFQRLTDGVYRMDMPFSEWGNLSKIWQPTLSVVSGTRWLDYQPEQDSSANWVNITNYLTSSVFSGTYTPIDGIYNTPIEIRIYN